MTSLAAQLKKLAVPETQNLLTRDLRQDSFLYDEGEAATFEKQHFYNIGVNGLLQLIEKDPRFADYEQTLFSPSSQSLQRFVQTTEVNNQLDASISTFLLQLSPYMQLREAHKAIEWMVHRYKVHLRNVNAFMMCVLPYHDQEPFVRALRLLKLSSQECAMWRWLEPVKKGGMFLPTATLITHCRSAKGFLGFMCDMLRKHIQANTDDSGTPSDRQLQRVITFFTQTVLGMCAFSPATEAHVSVLIPSVSAGLKARRLPDYMASSYMILSQLFSQVSLEEKVLESLLNVIAKNAQSHLLDAALAVIILMFQTQAIKKISKKAYKYLSRQGSLVPVLARLSHEAKAEPFMVPFVTTLCQRLLKSGEGMDTSSASDSNAEDTDEAVYRSPLALALEILGAIVVKKSTVHAITRVLLEWSGKNLESLRADVLDEAMPAQGVFKVFRLLEQRFSEFLDSSTKELLASDTSGQTKSALEVLYGLSVVASKDELRSNPLSSLTLCLHHRDVGVRKNAVQRLLREPGLVKDVGDVQATLALRLQDDDPGVVKAVLQQAEVLWSVCTDKRQLHETLLTKYKNLEGSDADLRELFLQALLWVPYDVCEDGPLYVLAVSALLITSRQDMTSAKAIFSTGFGLNNPLLEHLAREYLPSLEKLKEKEADSLDVQCKMLISLSDAVTSYLLKQKKHESCLHFLKSLRANITNCPCPARTALVTLMVIQSLSEEAKMAKSKGLIQQQLVELIAEVTFCKGLVKLSKHAENQEWNQRSVLSNCLSSVTGTGRLTLDFILFILTHMQWESIPKTLQGNGFMLQSDMGESDAVWLGTMVQAFTFLLKVSTSKRSQGHPLTDDIFAHAHKALGSPECMLRFLCTLWLKEDLSGEDKARSLNFAQVYLSALPEGVRANMAAHFAPALPCLLLLLSHQSEKVRAVAFNLMSGLYDGLSPESLNSKWFVDSLLRYKEEVLKDEDFLGQTLKNILEGEDLPHPPSPKRRRKTSSRLPAPSVALGSLLELLSEPSTPLGVKAGLLACLTRLDTAESFIPLTKLLKDQVATVALQPTGVEESDGHVPSLLDKSEGEIIALLLRRYTPTVAGCVEDNTACLDALLACLNCDKVVADSEQSVQCLALEQLSGSFVGSLPYASRKAVFKTILDLVCQSSSTTVQRKCRKVIKHITLESSIVNEELKQISKQSTSSVREAKQKKAKVHEENSTLDSAPWRRVKCLLEMIQNKKKLTQAVLMVPEVFCVLARLLEVEEKGSGEYLKQLLLGTISNICGRQQKETGDVEEDEESAVKGEHLNMELIVQCIRGSDNPHTHHQALILLSQAAKIAPDLLLHNMMSVFTFMGANILRQDDSYSFHVIARILENVIPALRMACEEKAKPQARSRRKQGAAPAPSPMGSEVIMTVVLRVFVDAIPHIPAHRKMAVFGKLLAVVGAEDHLWKLMLLLMERVTSRGVAPTDGGDQEEAHDGDQSLGPVTVSDLEFLLSLSEELSCPQLLASFTQALTYLAMLPEEKVGNVLVPKMSKDFSLTDLSDNERQIFSVAHHSAKQLRHFKYASVYVLREMVGSQHFISQMAAMNPSEFQVPFQQLMETTLQLIGQFTKSHDQASSLPAGKAKFWRVLLHKAHDLLDGLVQLLPEDVFLQVCTGLMGHPLALVQRRTLELINAKLAQYRDSPVPADQVQQLSGLVSHLSAMVRQTLLKAKKANCSGEELVIGQLALYSLKVLCRCMPSRRQDFLPVLELCTSVLSRQQANGMVCASAMLCSAEVVSACGVYTLEHLTRLMPLIVAQLQADTITHHEVLLVSSLTAVQKIVEAVPQFLSPYLQDLVVQVCIISAASDRPAVTQKVKAICTCVATVTPTRSFLPVLEKSLSALDDRLPSCASCALSMLQEHVVHMGREDLATFCPSLLNFFLVCLDLRVTQPLLSGASLDAVEECVIEAFVALVFKLSEAQFKPMLIQLYTWATEEDQSKDRVLVFYKLCDRLAQKLKSLFTLFAGHILKHSAQVLEANNRSKGKCRYFGSGKEARKKSCAVLVSVLGCVQNTLAHDTEGFVNKERFDLLMQPLVDQLENQLGKPSVCESRVSDQVVPCLAHLAAAAQDDALWKDLNYQILLKTRHEEPKVRIWALSAIDALHKQLGEDYTQLVPETIPFLAELMEDDSDEVEKHTHKVLAAMEVSVGESLQEYF